MQRTFVVLLLLLAASCTTTYDWLEVQTAPMKFMDAYRGLTEVAQGDGYLPDRETDSGLGIYQSRWRRKNLGLGQPGRFRVRAEITEGGNEEQGWTIRFYIEQQIVDELRQAFDPKEEDWGAAGQDGERQTIFGERLWRRLKPEGPRAADRT